MAFTSKFRKVFSKINEKFFYMCFSRMHVYNVLWEDSRVDLRYFSVDDRSRLLTISAAGCGVASELIKNPQVIDAVDLNLAHLAITAFKVNAARLCRDYEEYSHLMSEGRDALFFKKYPEFYQNVPEDIARWWKKNEAIIVSKGLYRSGLTVKFMGLMKRLTSFQPSHWFSLSAQERIAWGKKKFEFLERISQGLGLSTPHLSMGISRHQAALLVDEKGSFMKAFSNGFEKYCYGERTSPFVYYIAYQRLPLVQESLPPFVQKQHFSKLRSSSTQVNYLHQNIFAVLAATPDGYYTHINLADAIEWLDADQKQKLLEETARVLAPDGELLYRSVVKNHNVIETYRFTHVFQLDEAKTEAASQEDESFLYEKVYFFRRVQA